MSLEAVDIKGQDFTVECCPQEPLANLYNLLLLVVRVISAGIIHALSASEKVISSMSVGQR